MFLALLSCISSISSAFSRCRNCCGEPWERSCTIEDVNFPPSDIFSPLETASMVIDMTLKPSLERIGLVVKMKTPLEKMHGLPKTDDTMKPLFACFTHSMKYKDQLPGGYQQFGGPLPVKDLLKELILSNPFFASPLKAIVFDDGTKGYLINAHESKDNKSWFARFVDTYDENFPRVNIALDTHMNVKSYDAFTSKGNTLPLPEEEAIGRLLFLMTYYFECIHTLIHIYHTLLIAGLVDSTRGTELLGPFARQYEDTIYLK